MIAITKTEVIESHVAYRVVLVCFSDGTHAYVTIYSEDLIKEKT